MFIVVGHCGNKLITHSYGMDVDCQFFFLSENIFPVLGEYSTNVEYSIKLVVLNRTRLLKHRDTLGTIVSNIIDEYGTNNLNRALRKSINLNRAFMKSKNLDRAFMKLQ